MGTESEQLQRDIVPGYSAMQRCEATSLVATAVEAIEQLRDTLGDAIDALPGSPLAKWLKRTTKQFDGGVELERDLRGLLWTIDLSVSLIRAALPLSLAEILNSAERLGLANNEGDDE